MGKLFSHLSEGTPRLGILIDPEKNTNTRDFNHDVKRLIFAQPDIFLVGGSSATRAQTVLCVEVLKKQTQIPVVLFPGSADQFSKKADAMLFLSLISSRNPQYLIEEQIKSAEEVYHSGIETIPTGYLLLDGGTTTSTSRVTKTAPVDQKMLKLIENTALAGTLMGHLSIYLDAGSGALNPVSEEVIALISPLTKLLIVGGGLRNIEAVKKIHLAGANLVVIGNQLEKDPDFVKKIAAYQKSKNSG